jgi:BioD-like phosphotransacetylase family protein
MVHATRVNALMLKALDAELVLVAAPRSKDPDDTASAVAIAARGYGALPEHATSAAVSVATSRRAAGVLTAAS